VRFAHRDVAAVARVVARLPRRAQVTLVTDGMFAHSGQVAPLREYLRVLPRSARLLVDDAHGAGVVGANGRGSLEHADVGRERVIQCVTLSKAFGAYGGAILGSCALRERLLHARLFIGSTPPLPLVAAALVGLKLALESPSRRARLDANSRFIRTELARAEVGLDDCTGPIIALTPRTVSQAARLRRQLLQRGVLPPFIQYSGGPAEGCFRFVISSEHTRRDLASVAAALAAVR
jgi:7-keto-8-aminopelargonate synthetase-like enzyme